jgi:hypothetical protein
MEFVKVGRNLTNLYAFTNQESSSWKKKSIKSKLIIKKDEKFNHDFITASSYKP